MHYSTLRGINRTAWGTKLLLTTVLANPSDCISLCHIMKAQHCCLSPNGFFSPPLASHPPPRLPPSPSSPPTPIDSMRDATGTEKKLSKNQLAWRISYNMIATYITILFIQCTYLALLYYNHKRTTVHSIFQISISQNTKCADRSHFWWFLTI